MDQPIDDKLEPAGPPPPDQPVVPSQPVAYVPPPPPLPRQPVSVRPSQGRLVHLVLPLISLLAVALLWLRMDGEIRQLKDNQRRLVQEIASLKQTATIDISGAPALGPDDAVVTLVEFSDYECPFCIRHFQQTMPQIQANFINTGRIRYVFRDYPIDELHPQAIRAHEVARCALEQDPGKYWNLHRTLFSAPGTHTKDTLDARARDAGLDTEALQSCVASGRVTAGIRAGAKQAESLGADGTPAFFVGLRDRDTNEVRVLQSIKGAHPYTTFAQAIERALDQAK
jgi:protein-disulfide isomerase